VWSDAEDHGENACVKDKAWGGLDLPLEVVGVEAEDGGGQSSTLLELRVMRR
jgi:hypothetical protein